MRHSGDTRARREGGRTKPAAERVNLYDEVTSRIIAELEAGRFPWVQPWDASPNLPRNALSGRRYSGVNVLLLWAAAIEGAYPSQSWLTFRQALEAGGNVRKGERGTTVVYADRFIPEAEKARAAQSGDAARAIPFLKRFTVFNVAQCEGLREGLMGDPEPRPEPDIIPHAEALIQATGADFRIGGGEAYYSQSGDYVAVPPRSAFADANDFYDTAFHELSHWTGHPMRLARDMGNRSDMKKYGREELVAEISASFIGAALGLVPTVRHADYAGFWLGILREDNRAIFRAASQASKAADYILAFDETRRAANDDELPLTGG
ncbi:MAG TPA: zincin-like metallopeptidase domain-containing protein [Sphingopyxis sp.]|nr:zincin-like metallopeptidase domain-containing protein [Sphingopyxis sp.]HMP43820.1 zincin-like metallopeptidase domain-containing protein [Sphingopyxis sp.]HMQ20579.1 zincin-like metallopeptidase domain-containing protein [Sphingopyxis sp.]